MGAVGDGVSAPDWLAQWKTERRAGTPLVAIVTPDVQAAPLKVVRATPEDVPVLAWSCSSGLASMNRAGFSARDKAAESLGGVAPESIANLGDMLVAARALPERTVLLILNAHLGWGKEVARDAAGQLRDAFKEDQRTLAFVVPDAADMPRELAADVRVVREQLPSADDRRDTIAGVYEGAAGPNGLPPMDDATLRRAVNATAGLTAFAVEQATAVALRKEGLDVAALRTTAFETINARRGLRVGTERLTRKDVGGLNALLDFASDVGRGPEAPSVVVLVDEIEKAMAGSGAGGDSSGTTQDLLGQWLTWTEASKVFGMLLMGPPGSGKSLAAQAIAGELQVPLVWCDMAGMKASLVGESGANMRAALQTIDAVAGGPGKVMVVATCNGVSELRPELLRRFKPRFMVDLPSVEALEEIWRIQLEAHGLGTLAANKARLPDATGWTGAEVRDVCRIARATGMTPKDAARFVIPLSVSSAEAIARVRTEARGRFVDAFGGGPYRGPDVTPTVQPRSRKLTVER